MVRRQHAQRNIFEMILPDGEKLWDPALRRIDEVLEDEALIDQVEEALRRRRPKSGVRGRPGTPVAVVLRMLVLKHLYQWSFEECEREVRGSLVYRAFCHIGCEAVPDDTTAAPSGARAEAAGGHHGGGDEHSSSYRQHAAPGRSARPHAHPPQNPPRGG